MPRYYYGTVPVLAWIINHYFYARTHYAWLADAFHPHGTNPGSSNPYRLYGHLYEPWADRDAHDHVVQDYRRTLAKGVLARESAGLVDNITAARLRRLCKVGRVDLFYPVLYRVNVDAIPAARRVIAGSGLKGSHEVLIKDLRESEFDLLFADNVRDDYFTQMVLGELEGAIRMHPMAALAQLETRAE